MNGYLSPEYAASFAEFGTPVALAKSGGWLLRRRIPGTEHADAMGLYPVACCADWAHLRDDLDALADGTVSVTLVPDPFGDHTSALLQRTFDRVRPFKPRFVTDLAAPPATFISSHHRKCAQKGLDRLEVERCADPGAHLDEWLGLYGATCRRHRINDIRTFSPASFRQQLAVPGLVMFRARHEGRTVAMHLWITQGDCGYGHLAGHSEDAYRLNASYALYWRALHEFHGRLARLDLGAVAGLDSRSSDGLAFFKKGWSTGTVAGYICGRTLRADLYGKLVRVRHPEPTDFYPAYRAPRLPASAGDSERGTAEVSE